MRTTTLPTTGACVVVGTGVVEEERGGWGGGGWHCMLQVCEQFRIIQCLQS